MNTPSIVYVLADDLGFGDVSCLNPQGKIRTSNIDRLASDGMRFCDAHSTSAVCSPSRYGILTGRYNWRSTLQRGIVEPYGDPLIGADRLTVPEYLRRHGYRTGCIGKWHLGQGWDFSADDSFVSSQAQGEARIADTETRRLWDRAFSKPTTGGPTTRGFDYYFGVDVPNWPPYCFIENRNTVGIPSEYLPGDLLGNNIASIGGPAMPGWRFEALLPTWADKADEFIGDCVSKDRRFFLYLPLTSPHTPLSVNEPWIGASGLDNRYADLVIETDAVFGRMLDSLERHGVDNETLVVFASDNGCAHYIGAADLEARGHFPSGELRGYKSDAWDGGHRIPFISRWPGVIEPDSECRRLVSLSDLFATVADIIGDPLPDTAGEDSVSLLPLMKGCDEPVRRHVVHHSIDGKFAIRDGRWKLVLCPGSGGWTKRDAEAAKEGLPIVQLYDLESDIGEQTNLWATHRDIVHGMIETLKEIVENGRSTPGNPQRNDAPVDIWKLDTMPGVSPAILDDL